MPDEPDKPVSTRVPNGERSKETRIVSLEQRVERLYQRVNEIDGSGTVIYRKREEVLESELRRFSKWVESVDKTLVRVDTRVGELVQGQEDIRDEVRGLQGIVEAGNGHDGKNGK